MKGRVIYRDSTRTGERARVPTLAQLSRERLEFRLNQNKLLPPIMRNYVQSNVRARWLCSRANRSFCRQKGERLPIPTERRFALAFCALALGLAQGQDAVPSRDTKDENNHRESQKHKGNHEGHTTATIGLLRVCGCPNVGRTRAASKCHECVPRKLAHTAQDFRTSRRAFLLILRLIYLTSQAHEIISAADERTRTAV